MRSTYIGDRYFYAYLTKGPKLVHGTLVSLIRSVPGKRLDGLAQVPLMTRPSKTLRFAPTVKRPSGRFAGPNHHPHGTKVQYLGEQNRVNFG